MLGVDDVEPFEAAEHYVEVEETLVETRRATATDKCVVEGLGLRASVVRQPTSFTIVAYDENGDQQEDGGDPMFVSIRGCGVRVRAKVVDQGDGSCLVTYKTEVSGSYQICISHFGESLPGSPFTMLATTPSPVAEQCVIRGEALHRAVARISQVLEVEFRDAGGHVAHAEELNVYVVRIEQGPEDAYRDAGSSSQQPDSEVEHEQPAEPQELGNERSVDDGRKESDARDATEEGGESSNRSKAKGSDGGAGGGKVTVLATRLEDSAGSSAQSPVPKLHVGVITSKQPLIVRASHALDSERIGQLKPGRRIYLLDVREEKGPNGGVRALAAVDDDDDSEKLNHLRKPGQPLDNSWREHWLSRPFWRDMDLQEEQDTARHGGWYGDTAPIRRPGDGSPRRKLPIGWVTVAKQGRNFVNLSAQLPASVRQAHMQAWARRLAVDKTIDIVQKSYKERNDDSESGGGASRRNNNRPGANLSKAALSALKEKSRKANRDRFMNELSVDGGIGFAFGGIYPGKVHARGKLVEVHRVSYSIGLVGTYELHVGLRQCSQELPGSPYRLEVVPGPASAVSTGLPPDTELPLLGTVGSGAQQGCKLRLPLSDKMGNRCVVGGTKVECSCSTEGVKSQVEDNEDGSFALSWRSDKSGSFVVQIFIDKEPIVGSPFKMQLLSDMPELSKTNATGNGLSEARAGTPAEVQLQLLDQFGNVAIGGGSLSFGITIARAGDKEEKTRWKRQELESDPFSGAWDREVYDISYVPEKAGVFDLYLWALDGNAAEKRRLKKQADAEEDPFLDAGPKSKKPAKESGKSGEGGDEKNERELLPGSPFKLVVSPGEPDAGRSTIDGFSKAASEEKEKKDDKKEKKADAAVAAKPQAGRGGLAASDVLIPSGASVGAGENLSFKPVVRDRFGNTVNAKEGTLEIVVSVPAFAGTLGDTSDDKGPTEARVAVAEQVRGDTAYYEGRFCPKVLGPYLVYITLDGEPISGSPLQFEVLAGLPDVKMSKFEIPQPPLFSATEYDLVLISIDKYGNQCTRGGAVIAGKLTGPNLPPGQDANVEVQDEDDGRYVLKLWLKAPADVKLIVTVAREVGAGQPPNIIEFPHMSLKFESIKAFKAREEREALKAASAGGSANKGADGGEEGAAAPPGALKRSQTMGKLPEPTAVPDAAAPTPAAAKKLGKAGLKLKGAVVEIMDGFGTPEQRRAKPVDAEMAVEMAVEAFKEEGAKGVAKKKKDAVTKASSPPKAQVLKRAMTSKALPV